MSQEGSYVPRQTVYVDTVTGTSNANGSLVKPVSTLIRAMSILEGSGGGTIKVRAPENAPLGVTVIEGYHDVTIEPWDAGTIWYGNTGSNVCITYVGRGKLIMRYPHLTGGGYGFRQGSDGEIAGEVEIYYGHADGGTSGWQTTAVWSKFTAYFSNANAAINDGFNFHCDPGVICQADVYDGSAHGCGDEGISYHDDVIGTIYGGDYSANKAGMTHVGNSIVNLRASLTNGAPIKINDNEERGIRYVLPSTGDIGVEGIDYISTGNGMPDELPV